MVDPTPPDDDLVRVLPREDFPSSGGWIDNIAQKIDHLVSLLTQADGWIHISALKRYSGPAVPGNQDPHTNTIIHNRTFAICRSGSSIPLDGAALYNMVAFDNRRRKFRLTLGEMQGSPNNQLAIALSSTLPRKSWIARFPPLKDGPPPLLQLRLLCLTSPPSAFIFAVRPP